MFLLPREPPIDSDKTGVECRVGGERSEPDSLVLLLIIILVRLALEGKIPRASCKNKFNHLPLELAIRANCTEGGIVRVEGGMKRSVLLKRIIIPLCILHTVPSTFASKRVNDPLSD